MAHRTLLARLSIDQLPTPQPLDMAQLHAPALALNFDSRHSKANDATAQATSQLDLSLENPNSPRLPQRPRHNLGCMRFDVSLSALCHRDRNGLQLYDVPVNELKDSTEALCMYPDPQALLLLSSK